MIIDLVTALLLGALYAVGFYLLMQRSLMRVILGLMVLGHAANLFLQAAGGAPAAPPFAGVVPTALMADPLPQALALTAVVITFGLTTFLLALAYRSWVVLGHDEVRDDVEDRRLREAGVRTPGEHGYDADSADSADSAGDAGGEETR